MTTWTVPCPTPALDGPDEREEEFSAALADLAERRAMFRELGHVPTDFLDRLKRAGIFRAGSLARFGGAAEAPADFLRRIERLARVDASTAWVAGFGHAQVYLAALPVATQEELYREGIDVAFHFATFPPARAERVDGGWRLSGTWRFASGCTGADLLGLGIRGEGEDKGRILIALVRPDQVRISDDWDVNGMQATGSHSVVAEGVHVSDGMTFVRAGAPTVDEPVTRYPVIAYSAQALAVTALGAAQAAIDVAVSQGAPSRSITGGRERGRRPIYRAAVGEAEARLRAVRAWFYSATEGVWSKCWSDTVTDSDAAELRLAAAHAAREARAVVLDIYDVVGTGAIMGGHPLQPILQDALIPAQHASLQASVYEQAGGMRLGYEPEAPGFP